MTNHHHHRRRCYCQSSSWCKVKMEHDWVAAAGGNEKKNLYGNCLVWYVENNVYFLFGADYRDSIITWSGEQLHSCVVSSNFYFFFVVEHFHHVDNHHSNRGWFVRIEWNRYFEANRYPLQERIEHDLMKGNCNRLRWRHIGYKRAQYVGQTTDENGTTTFGSNMKMVSVGANNCILHCCAREIDNWRTHIGPHEIIHEVFDDIDLKDIFVCHIFGIINCHASLSADLQTSVSLSVYRCRRLETPEDGCVCVCILLVVTVSRVHLCYLCKCIYYCLSDKMGTHLFSWS